MRYTVKTFVILSLILKASAGLDSIASATYPFLTWATEFIDYDNDGWKDIFLVNGHVFPEVGKNNFGTSFAERPLLFHNVNQGKKFELMPAVIGTGLADVLTGAAPVSVISSTTARSMSSSTASTILPLCSAMSMRTRTIRLS